ncbi:tetratricopeptide repeat protein [Micromonospora sp. bgisy143]|uniref:tetratricopeptide repeat protein n=1 Tax=Micromonospora sp. bgisy143 TaxID=3413790 RepID=UPI003EB73B03
MFYQQRRVAGHPVRLDPRPARIAGREELLNQIADRLTVGSQPVVVALSALGGVGKTTAAVEFAHRHLDRYEVVWMFHAEDPTALVQQFHDLTQLLDPADLLDQSDPVTRLHAALAGRDRPWLLVLDNIRDYAMARRWLPPRGNGHVLVTTQDGHWPAEQTVPIGPLSVEAAAGFLLSCAGEYDEESARKIATELGSLPLALAQAGAYVQTTGRSLAEYLTLLHTNRMQLLRRGAPSSHQAPVTATWSVALTELADTSPDSITLLRLLSHLAPEDIPHRLLLATGTPLPPDVHPEVAHATDRLRSDQFALDDAVAGLRRHSLIGPPAEVVTVHRLVQHITLEQIDPDQRQGWQTAATALVEAAIPADTSRREAWPICAQLLPHALALLDPIGVPIWRLARSFGHAGDYPTSVAVWSILAEAHTTQLGPEHPDTLSARHELASWTGDAGDAVAARDLYAQLLPVRQRVSGVEHPDTLSARANLAYWTGEAGDAVAARDLYAQLLPVQDRVSGVEHPDTLTARANLAYWTGKAGDAVAARDLYAQLLPVRQRVSGADHPDTLSARANLAYWTGKAGDVVAARDLFAQLLPVQDRVSGVEHPDTLSIGDNLAYWTGKAGDAVTARDLFGQLLPVRERVLGAEHPNTLATRANLAYWTGMAGDAVAARDLFGELLPVRERVSGAKHPDTLSTRANFDYWRNQADR